MNTETITQEKIRERATFELDQLTTDATRTRIHGLAYLEKITKEVEKMKKMIESPDCKPENLRTDHVTWIQHYSKEFENHIQQAEKIERIVQDLKYTIQLVKETK